MGCVFSELGRADRGVCVPAILGYSGLPVESAEGRSVDFIDLSTLAGSAVVPNAVEHGMRHPSGLEAEPRAPEVGQRGDESIMQRPGLPVSRLEVVRAIYGKQGFSGEVVELFVGSIRANTTSAYGSAWRNWTDWCVGRGSDPMSNDLIVVTAFLAEQSRSKSYSTVNVYRSALSATLEKVEGFPVGQHPKILLLMKGIYNKKPPTAKYDSVWDVDTVLSHLKSKENAPLPLCALASKLATLLALAILFRASDLASINFKSIVFAENRVSFALNRPRKAHKSESLQSFSLEKLDDELLDPVACLRAYIFKTEAFRGPHNEGSLFISSVGQHNPVKSVTISGWIKQVLREAGIDINMFSAHSTRGPAASKAVAAGISVDTVLRAGHWASASTFRKFYHREVPTDPSLVGIVLQPDVISSSNGYIYLLMFLTVRVRLFILLYGGEPRPVN